MKIYYLLTAIIAFQVNCYSQQHAHFQYDAAGNRRHRYLDVQQIKPVQRQTDSATISMLTNSVGLQRAPQNKLPEQDNAGVSLAPNPTNASVFITFSGANEPGGCQLRLYSNNGKLLQQQEKLSLKTEINLSHYSNGNYFLIITYPDGKKVYWKVVKTG